MIADTSNVQKLALLGGTPAFSRPLPFGQGYFPDWARYEAVFRDIFERQYYTNHGPLAQQLEARLAAFLQVKHAICVTNGMIALCIAAQAQELRGKIVVPAWTNPAVVGSVMMAGLEPVFCDVASGSAGLTATQVEPLLTTGVSAILVSNVGADAADVVALEALAARAGVAIYFDSAQALGCVVDGKPIGSFGRLEVFSLHSENILSATEGGCICTNDDGVAAKIRNIRGNYGRGHFVPVAKTGNGRMSEAQAAIALMNFDDLAAHQARNARVFDTYRSQLTDIPGVRLRIPCEVEHSNHQCVTCEIDAAKFGLDVQQLVAVFHAENAEVRHSGSDGSYSRIPAGHAAARSGFPVAEQLAATTLQLPVGAHAGEAMATRVASLLRQAQVNAKAIQTVLV